MDQPPASTAPETAPPADEDEELLEEDLLVEDVSLDGMCGVYWRVGSRSGLGAGAPGLRPARAVRRAALPLRDPAAVVPEGPAAAGGRGGPRGRTVRPPRLRRRRNRPVRHRGLRTGPGPAGRDRHAPGADGVSVAVPLVEHFARGLDAPICLTWELTYACNLACRHCLSSSGRRDPAELSTAEARAVIDELERMQVFYVNIGGGEPTIRPDFWELVDYATAHHVGVKFSTNGVRVTPEVAERLAQSDYVDVQISLDGATA